MFSNVGYSLFLYNARNTGGRRAAAFLCGVSDGCMLLCGDNISAFLPPSVQPCCEGAGGREGGQLPRGYNLVRCLPSDKVMKQWCGNYIHVQCAHVHFPKCDIIFGTGNSVGLSEWRRAGGSWYTTGSEHVRAERPSGAGRGGMGRDANAAD